MPAPIVFLEIASAHKQSVDDAAAVKTSLELVQTLRQLRQFNPRVSLNSEVRLHDCGVAPNHTFSATLGRSQYKEEWDFLRLLATQSPLSSGMEGMLPRAQLTDVLSESGQRFHGENGAGLIWAHLMETATVSFNTESPWNSSWVESHFQTLDDAGNLVDSFDKVRNASTTDHAREHEKWLRALGLSSSPSGSDFWKTKDTRFPGLRFLDRVESQIVDLSTSGAPYKQALKSLESLNQDSIKWAGSGEPLYSEKVADGEHDGRKELSKFLDNATGQYHSFGKHAYFTGGTAGRIHFRLAPEESKFVIAHVGFKLQ